MPEKIKIVALTQEERREANNLPFKDRGKLITSLLCNVFGLIPGDTYCNSLRRLYFNASEIDRSSEERDYLTVAPNKWMAYACLNCPAFAQAFRKLLDRP